MDWVWPLDPAVGLGWVRPPLRGFIARFYNPLAILSALKRALRRACLQRALTQQATRREGWPKSTSGGGLRPEVVNCGGRADRTISLVFQ
jgi:hypothetical protein